MEIREYAPIAQQYGPGWVGSDAAETPAIAGSVSDGSDATFVELGAGRGSDGTYHSDLLTCIFAPIAPAEFSPRYMHMMVRVRTPDGFDVDGATGSSDIRFRTYYTRADDATGESYWDDRSVGRSVAEPAQGYELPAGLIAAPTWYRFYYLASVANKVIDPTVAPDSDHWRPVDPDMEYYAWDSLTGPGLRFDMYGLEEGFDEPKRSWLDVFEVRLVVAGDVLSATRRRAHLRQYPRSPLRQWPPERSVQRSNRQGPGAYR